MGKPLTRTEQPTEFMITTCVFSAAAVAGVVIVIADFLL
jgi:hypothetical protein